VIGWEDYVISLVSKGFPYKDQIEELFVVIVYFMHSQHVTFSLISLFKLQHTYQRHEIACLCQKCRWTQSNNHFNNANTCTVHSHASGQFNLF